MGGLMGSQRGNHSSLHGHTYLQVNKTNCCQLQNDTNVHIKGPSYQTRNETMDQELLTGYRRKLKHQHDSRNCKTNPSNVVLICIHE